GTNVDPDAIHKARAQLRRTIGRTLEKELEALYRTHKDTGPYSPHAEAVGRRALRNAALGMLAANPDAKTPARVLRHFRSATNMTDQIAALAILSHTETPEREKAFSAFYKRWKDDHLVIDAWFSQQAGSTAPGTLQRVRELMDHELFSLRNPNKVRALIAPLAMNNPVTFHSPDGEGYRLVADTVMSLDEINPQIAARLLNAFRSWKTMETGRQRQARKQLQRISRKKNLSPDVFEITSRTLN
ncbi:MAG: aminopeptidase N C-terminal domain-containing protein, partial [Pseudomonadota bacterium]